MSDASGLTADVFSCYLNHILPFDRPRYHPLSVAYGQVLLASTLNVEAEALALGPAVEMVLKHAFADLMQEPAPVCRDIDVALKTVEAALAGSKLLKRIAGAISRLRTRSVESALRRLEENGMIQEGHVTSWRVVRHSTAHGAEIGSTFRELIEHCDRAYQLLVILLLATIGYGGWYTNWLDQRRTMFNVNGERRDT